MIEGKTPFYDKNRKTMFYNIIAKKPTFGPNFTPEAVATITGLLIVDDKERLGSKGSGVRELKESPYFVSTNFEAVYQQELTPPFIPDVSGELDTKYVPKVYLNAEAEDSFSAPGVEKSIDANFNDFAFAGESTTAAMKTSLGP